MGSVCELHYDYSFVHSCFNRVSDSPAFRPHLNPRPEESKIMIKTYVYGQTLVSVLAPVRSHVSV